MNLTYFKFLFVTTIRKRPIWITWLLCVITSILFLLLMPGLARMSPMQVWSNTTMAICQSFLGMVVALFSAVLAIGIFKEPKEEGTELIVVSKPVSRVKLVFSKFAIFICFGILVNLTIVLFTCFTAFLPMMEKKFYWGLVLSMFIGNFISFGVFGSLAALVATKTQKVGVIVVNVLTSLILLIYQILTLFVFTTPKKALSNNHVSTSTLICLDRKEDGSYDEKRLVEFEPSIGENELTGKFPSFKTPDDVVKFWEDDILGKDISPILTITDLASQLALTYDSVATHQFSERQASRMFAMSRFYRYKLTSPASTEIIGNENNGIQSVYAGLNWFETSEGDEYPYLSNILVPTVMDSDVVALQGYIKDNIPVGLIRDTQKMFGRSDVYFEKEQYNKFTKDYIDDSGKSHEAPFKQIAEHIFDPDIKYEDGTSVYGGKEDTNPLNWGSLWHRSQNNIAHYYELIWFYLMGCPETYTGNKPEWRFNGEDGKIYNQEFFGIKTPFDLNERFIQFKRYMFDYLQQEQNKLLNSVEGQTIKIGEQTYTETNFMELNPKESAKTELTQLTGPFNVEYGNTWWVQAGNNTEAMLPMLQPGTRTPTPTFMYVTKNQIVAILEEKGASEEEINDVVSQTSIAKFFTLVDMGNNVLVGTEKYLFDSLSAPTRTPKTVGEIYYHHVHWTPYWISCLDPIAQYALTGYVSFPHDSSIFYFSTTPVIQYWIFAVIWGLISIAAYAGAALIYSKEDIK